MKRTLISHFYNEEWLLPWFLNHHKTVFDHGIMIDYNSTDRSVEIIKEICPTWEIHKSKNPDFGVPRKIDQEVQDYERKIDGWRMALNVTEFLVGNLDHLGGHKEKDHYLGQWVFVDVEDPSEPRELDSSRPIHEQRHWAYKKLGDWELQSMGSTCRPPRSIHNYFKTYPAGRHYWKQQPTVNDLCVFYYGWASIEPKSIARKMQIQHRIPKKPADPTRPGGHHFFTTENLIERFRQEQKPLAKNISSEISKLVNIHEATKNK